MILNSHSGVIDSKFDLFSYDLMFSCWAVRPKDRPSFKDVLRYLSSILDLHDKDESDAMVARRHKTNASATRFQDVEIAETSFSTPSKRLRQATITEDDPITNLENVGTMEHDVEWLSSLPEYLVPVESPMLQSHHCIVGDGRDDRSLQWINQWRWTWFSWKQVQVWAPGHSTLTIFRGHLYL